MQNEIPNLAFIPAEDVTDIVAYPDLSDMERRILIAIFEDRQLGQKLNNLGSLIGAAELAEILDSTPGSIRVILSRIRKKGLLDEVDVKDVYAGVSGRVRRVMLPGAHVVRQRARRIKRQEHHLDFAFRRNNDLGVKAFSFKT